MNFEGGICFGIESGMNLVTRPILPWDNNNVVLVCPFSHTKLSLQYV